MGILTTTFVRYDGEKIYYPNSVLATKPISNFNRSDEMGDSVEFTVDFSTSVDSIAELKEKVKTYVYLLLPKPLYIAPTNRKKKKKRNVIGWRLSFLRFIYHC